MSPEKGGNPDMFVDPEKTKKAQDHLEAMLKSGSTESDFGAKNSFTRKL